MLFALDLDMMNILHLALAGLLNLKLVLSKERCFFSRAGWSTPVYSGSRLYRVDL